jgi:hypothetical protein
VTVSALQNGNVVSLTKGQLAGIILGLFFGRLIILLAAMAVGFLVMVRK